VRLSAHVFLALVNSIDLLEAPRAMAAAGEGPVAALPRLRRLAESIRRNLMRVAWEDGTNAGFITTIHECRADGSLPDYARGAHGYTLGSMSGSDFDGARRRDLTAQAYGMRLLQVERDYLTPVADAAGKAARLLDTCDRLLFDPKLGLRLIEPPVSNDEVARRLVGRMGIVPAGCAENGEYHHGQMMMHRFRMLTPGEADRAWLQFKPIVSAMRDASLAGPFEMPSTSYASDAADPHFGKGMYFGLSGSTDWIVEFLQDIAGLELALHDDRRPALRVTPRLPAELKSGLTLRRVIHAACPGGGYRCIPLTLTIRPARQRKSDFVRINGRTMAMPELASLEGIQELDIVVNP